MKAKKEVLCALSDEMTGENTVMQHFKTLEQAKYSFRKSLEKVDQQIWPFLKLVYVADVECIDGIYKFTAVNKLVDLELKKPVEA